MTNRHKIKGDKAELDLVKWLKKNGYPDARRTKAGWDEDEGDINLGPGKNSKFVEVKNHKTLVVNPWLDRMEEKMNEPQCERFDDAVLVVKRPGQADPGEWWVIRRVRDEF